MVEPENQKKSFQLSHIIIALLVLIIILQGVALLRQHGTPPATQKHDNAAMAPSLPPASFLRSKPVRPSAQTTPAGLVPQSIHDQADPFEEFDALSRRMSNMMRSAFMMSAPMTQHLLQMMGQGIISDFSPAIDLQETENAYIVRGDLPGLEKDKINLTVQNGMLTIEGVRQTSSATEDESRGYYAQERSYGSYARTITLPGPVDDSRITADYKDGVLTITLPKAAGGTTAQKVPVR
jgi:HSP20 family protein